MTVKYRLCLPLLLLVATIAFGLTGCNYWERERPIIMSCTTSKSSFVERTVEVFNRNGYVVTEADPQTGSVEARDTIERVEHGYSSLVRHWSVRHTGDSIVINVQSINTRKDDSEITQTWDKRWSSTEVKDWMRPVLIAIESNCGLVTPLRPR